VWDTCRSQKYCSDNSNTLGIFFLMIDSSPSPATHIWVTLTDFVLHISAEKRTKIMVFNKNAWSTERINDHKFLRTIYFSKFIFFMRF
jgi:hypothetical protein